MKQLKIPESWHDASSKAIDEIKQLGYQELLELIVIQEKLINQQGLLAPSEDCGLADDPTLGRLLDAAVLNHLVECCLYRATLLLEASASINQSVPWGA